MDRAGLAFLYAVSAVVESLRLVSLDVPSSVPLGDPVWLNCTLDKEQDDLYSVKWYKNDEEFYRYLPRDSPALQKYDLPGIYIDVLNSKEGSIFLTRTDQNSEGTFRCEASAEAPSFQTVGGEKDMALYALPTEDPSMQGLSSSYEIGDLVNVTCVSGKSRPAATLKWFINDKEASPHMLINSPQSNDTEGLAVSYLGLSFIADSSTFRQGTLVLRCLAVVSQIFAVSSEHILLGTPSSPQGSQPLPPSKRLAEDAPVITTTSRRLRAGDVVELNCSSPLARPSAHLAWNINDQKAPEEYVVVYERFAEMSDHPKRPVLGLQFQIQSRHFDASGELRLKCTATVSKVIHTRSDEKVIGGNQHSSGLHASESKQRVNSGSDVRWWDFMVVFLSMLLLARGTN